MTRKPNRTLPLDRDGDGRNGGSLPGNRTAPYAGAQADGVWIDEADSLPLDDLADARTMPGDSAEKLEAIEREVDEANAEARTAGNDALTAIAEVEPDLVAQVIEDHADDVDTFTAEEVEAADPHAPCSNCGDDTPVGVLDDGLRPLCVDEDDDHAESLAQMTNDANAETAQIAVRARELRLLVESRRLYKSAEGYSATYGAPYVDQATVDGWIASGLAENVPTAGICGGIKPTHEARRHLGQLTLGHYAPGTIGAAGEDA